MTFGVIRKIGHKFNRGEEFRTNWQRGVFLCWFQPGELQKCSHHLPALEEPFCVKGERIVFSISLFQSPQTLSHTNVMIITRTLHSDAI